MKNIVIIGAGAAGLMTAATILEDLTPNPSPSERGISGINKPFHIHLFDKNPIPGTKVALAGGGRCNLTTGIEDKKLLLSKYTRGSEFIKKALGKFSPRKCREWFEAHNLPLKLEADNRVFPASDEGLDVVEVFENIFAKHQGRITLHYGELVFETSLLSSLRSEDLFLIGRDSPAENDKTRNTFLQGRGQNPPTLSGIPPSQGGTRFLITTSKGTYESDILVIASGGNAYAHTGSSGDGYTFARSLGHAITQLGPSLSSFLTKEKWTHELSGLAFQNSQLKINNLQLAGPLLLTHFGISGPLAFQLSSHLAWEDIRSKTMIFSPISEMDFALWNSFLLEQFGLHPKKLIMSILVEKLPRRFAEGFVEEYFPHIRETFAASISRDDREKLAKLLGEGIPLTLLDRRPGDEFVTAGGVNTLEVNPETMESRIQKNLYFAGEVLNVDAVTGGFNLQACWAGGYSAGKDIVEKLSQTN